MHTRHVVASLAFTLALLGLIALLPAGQTPPGQTPPQPAGGLTGKRIYMSPGHGYYYDDDGTSPNLGWTTQRGDTFGLIEDIHTNEIVMQYLTQYLYRAGATVFPCRERDKQTNEVVINNEVGSPQYTETGSWTTTTSVGLGYAGTQYRYVATSATETATAIWRPTIPAAGYYSVSVWYYASSNRVTDAKYRITHSGGTSTVTVNQQIYSSRWLWLGEYYFEPGTAGYVTLSNQSSQTGVVIADAVRFGAGMGSINHGGGVSGKPRWKECSVYWLEYLGAPSSVTNYYGVDRNDDIVARPLYADWQEGPTWTPNACYYSQHTNAGGGTGTDTFVHDTSPSPGSIPYQDFIHPQIINDLRNAWDPAWYDRGQQTANFGEVRAVDSMPALLCELAFHDKQTPDNDYLWEDDFRRLAARAIYKGMLRYFTAAAAYAPAAPPDNLFTLNPNPAVTVSPLPPRNFRVINNGNGTLQCSWAATTDPLEASATPSAYKIYRSTNGKGFDDGTNVGNVTTSAVSGLTPGAVYYFQVTALNAGGESFPTETLCARVNSSGVARILIVNGFDRVDRSVRERENENSHDYVIQHAQAIAAVPSGVYYFDSASNEAVGSGLVTLTGYYTIDWILGEESTADETFSSAEQTQITNYLNGAPAAPRALFTSGAEVAWDLGQGSATAADISFLNNRLKAAYATDDAVVYTASGVTGSAFAGLSGLTFDDGTQGSYNVDYPDTFTVAGGGTSCMTYTGGAIAGVQYDTTFKVITLGFPFETLYPATTRTNVMEKVLQFLHPTPNSAPVITPVVPNITTNEDTPTTYSLATHETDAEDTIPNPNPLVWSINGPNPALFSASISQTTDLLTVTPTANASGSQVVTLVLTDSGGLTDTQNITVTIIAQNDAPTISGLIPNVSTWMGQPYTIDLTPYESDVDNTDLQLTWSASGADPAIYAVSINASTDVMTITPVAAGIDPVLTLRVTDSGGLFAQQNISVTVTSNSPPVILGTVPNPSMNEDTPYSYSLAGHESDVESGGPNPNGLTWSVTGLDPALASASVNAATDMLTITPVANVSGSDVCLLVLTDAGGATATQGVQVSVFPVNDAPVANAGPDQSVPPQKVTLNGSQSSDVEGSTLSYAWTQTGGPAVTITGPNTVSPTFIGITAGAYTFSLIVNDGTSPSAADTVVVTIQNVAPTADAGPDRDGGITVAITLNGSGSADPNGSALTYAWTQTGGAAVVLGGAATSTPSFTPATAGLYAFRLIVNDGALASAPDDVSVVVNDNIAPNNFVPTADAGIDQIVAAGTPVTLVGGESVDPEGTALTFAWTQVSGTAVVLAGSATASPTFTPTVGGVYVFSLTVTDGSGLPGTADTAQVIVNEPTNRVPRADAILQSPAQPQVGMLVTLSAAGSIDADGSGLSFAWTQTAGPSAVLSGFDVSAPTFTPTSRGTYAFSVTATDGSLTSPPAMVTVRVAPAGITNVADAIAAWTDADSAPTDGHANTVTTPTVTLNSSSSTSAANRVWTQVEGPRVVLSSSTATSPTFTPTISRVYAFQVTAWDANAVTDRDTVWIAVDTAANATPDSNAGPDQATTSGTPVTLAGSGTDANAAQLPIGIFYWIQTGGPIVTITGAGTSGPGFTPPVAGTYTFRLYADDGFDRSLPDTVVITASAGGGGSSSGGSSSSGSSSSSSSSGGSSSSSGGSSGSSGSGSGSSGGGGGGGGGGGCWIVYLSSGAIPGWMILACFLLGVGCVVLAMARTRCE